MIDVKPVATRIEVHDGKRIVVTIWPPRTFSPPQPVKKWNREALTAGWWAKVQKGK